MEFVLHKAVSVGCVGDGARAADCGLHPGPPHHQISFLTILIAVGCFTYSLLKMLASSLIN